MLHSRAWYYIHITADPVDEDTVYVLNVPMMKSVDGGKIIQVLHQTYEDEDAWETMLAGQLRFLMDVIDTTGAPVTAGALLRLADLKSQWSERQAELQAIKTDYIDVINEWARRQNVPHVASPG